MTDEITGNTNVKLESCFLGSVDVPFTTIYLNGNINGTFEVEVPKVNLGYLYERVGMTDKSHPFSPDRTVATHATASNPTAGLDARTFLYLLISVDPPLPLPSEPTVPPPRGENRRLLTYARRWEAKYKRNGAQALVMNSAVRRSACGEALVQAHTPRWLCLCGLVWSSCVSSRVVGVVWSTGRVGPDEPVPATPAATARRNRVRLAPVADAARADHDAATHGDA